MVFLEGNKVMCSRSWKMFVPFDPVKIYPGIYPKETEMNRSVLVEGCALHVACFTMEKKF